jgi:oxygen-independent coproporphyrinogen-3 oxidase
MTGQVKGVTGEPLGLYVHVPFCASTCDFCAFYQTEPTAAAVKGFLAGVEREARLVSGSRPVTTVFWGGGTPGLLAPGDLSRLGEVVRGLAGGRAPAEWSVELAPSSVTPRRLDALLGAGVTRVSLGVQSFQPDLLDALGRQHSVAQVRRAYGQIRAAGFASVNIDLMFALPGQTEEGWAEDVREAVALAPDHISTYCLTFEEDTALWIRLSQGRVRLDPEKEARFYEASWEGLEAAGYEQYEISNFARPGHACIHNLNTWRMGEWIGLGPSAASQHGGWRGANPADLGRWAGGLDRGERATEDRRELTQALLAEDAMIFGLRMNAGVDLGELKARFPGAPWPAVGEKLARLCGDGIAERDGTRVRLTRRGRLLADAVGEEMIAWQGAPTAC